MSNVILLCGKAASGKTTFAKAYCEAHPNTIVLSVDECMYEMMKECKGRKTRVEMEGNILRYFYSLSLQLLKRSFDVIIDHGYWLKQERMEAYTFYEAQNQEVTLHYFPVDQKTQFKRLHKRNEQITSLKQNIITETMCEQFNQFFEELDEIDNRYCVKHETKNI